MENRFAHALRRTLLAGAVLMALPAFAGIATSDPSALAAIALAKGSEKATARKPVEKKSAPDLKAAAAKASTTKPEAGKAGASKAASAKGGKPDPKARSKSAKKGGKTAVAKQDTTPGPLADFGKVEAPEEVVHVANWVSHTRNNGKRAFVVIDKKQAQLYVFDRGGKLKSRTPILLGKAIGDHTVPGVGSKPMSQVKEDEKTTPAGKFLARPGRNTSGEDIIWIDYDASVSMHRLRKVKAEEKRAERMATPEPDDNRISYGCVNVPPKFYDGVLKPTVMKQGAFVYVLPETKTPQQQFGSFDVPRGNAKG